MFIFSEMHRTQSEFDDNLTFKVFIFQFINFYSSIFYIAFFKVGSLLPDLWGFGTRFKGFCDQILLFFDHTYFKGRFVGYPGAYEHIFGDLRNEDVSAHQIELYWVWKFLNSLMITHFGLCYMTAFDQIEL